MALLQSVLSIRELSKAEQIVKDLEHQVSTKLTAQVLGTRYVIDDSFDIIVQATSVGLFDESSMIPVDLQHRRVLCINRL